MAIQYYMRAYNTILSQYVDWVVNDTPDTIGTFSGYPTGQLTNIIVNRTITSKIDNFLKPNQSLGGNDGNYFHVNSYDWLRATAPINPPTTLTGLAVERGITSVTTVTAATNLTPIQITTAGAHGFVTGALVTIAGVQGNIAANGTFPVTVLNATNFTLNGSQGSGTYTTGGVVYRPTDFSTLTWDEASNVWRFVVNTGGDAITLGSHQNLRVNNFFIDGYEALGTTPATAGILRIPNNQFIDSRDQGNTANIQLIGADNLNRIKVGLNTTDLVYMPGNLDVDGYVVVGINPPTSGIIRIPNNQFITANNLAGNVNLSLIGLDTTNKVVVGSSTNSGNLYNTSTGNLHGFQVNGTSTFEIGDVFARFTSGVVAPSILQVTPGPGVSGQTLTFQAQNGGTGATTGGIASIVAGTGGTAPGTVDLSTGSQLKVRVHPTVAPIAANNNSIQLFENRVRFDTAQVLPRVMQDDVVTSSAVGQAMYFQAQNATGTTSTGGNAIISSGAGTNSAGNVIIQTGGVNQIIVSPTLTTILGNVLITGTTTSVASTVIELADRVIHVNSSANQFPGNTIGAPSAITGFSVDRGSPTNTTKRDYYGLFWVESDGYWKFSANTDGYVAETTLFQNLPVMGASFLAQPLAGVVAGTIPTAGGFRALNNTTAVGSRNAAGTQDLLLLGTDSTNRIIHGAGTNNAGHLFNTTTSTIYDFQVNSVSTYTITPVSAGTTTLQATAGVTALVYTQTATGGATGANTTMSAQNAATTGGNLILSSGTGATAGNVQLQTGAVDRVVVRPTFTEFRDAAEAMRITPVSSGTTQQTFASTVTAVSMNQTSTAGTTGAPWTIQAQAGASSTGGNISIIAGNATTTGGNAIVTSGTGATAGNTQLQTGGVDRVIVRPTFTEFRDTAEAYRITPVSSGATTLQAASTATSVTYRQADLTTNAGTGASTTVQAQNETGTTSTGGALNLTSGSGTTTNGAVNLQVAGTTTASVVTNKFVFNKGTRTNVTSITTTYTVLATDSVVAVTTLAAPFTITLPTGATVGDTYVIKDATGNAGTNNLTIDGNGNNIDGAAQFFLTQPYAAATFIFLNGQWSVI